MNEQEIQEKTKLIEEIYAAYKEELAVLQQEQAKVLAEFRKGLEQKKIEELRTILHGRD